VLCWGSCRTQDSPVLRQRWPLQAGPRQGEAALTRAGPAAARRSQRWERRAHCCTATSRDSSPATRLITLPRTAPVTPGASSPSRAPAGPPPQRVAHRPAVPLWQHGGPAALPATHTPPAHKAPAEQQSHNSAGCGSVGPGIAMRCRQGRQARVPARYVRQDGDACCLVSYARRLNRAGPAAGRSGRRRSGRRRSGGRRADPNAPPPRTETASVWYSLLPARPAWRPALPMLHIQRCP
jgi:hypothetical protein